LYALWFGIPEDGAKTEAVLDHLKSAHPKPARLFSYYPEVMFRYGRNEDAYRRLLEVADPNSFGKISVRSGLRWWARGRRV
jgi:hypothetical protein